MSPATDAHARILNTPNLAKPLGQGISQIRKPIDVLNLTGIAHIPPVRALGKLMAQIRHGDVRPVSF
jgi:hypothetical protein